MPVNRRRSRRIAAAAIIALVPVLAVSWLLLTTGRDSTAAVESSGSSVAATEALAALAVLPVSDARPKGDYIREQFGQAWSDDVDVAGGHNGCDTRNDILRRDLTALELKPGTRDCVVLAGVLTDAYTGQVLAFRRGEQTSDDVQIDHLVALSEAWRSGAELLSPDERRDLANDPANLQATSGDVNQAKGDADAADWLPPDVAYRCLYVARQIDVKSRYRLSVSTAEREVMAGTLVGCGGRPPLSSSTAAEASTAAGPISTRPIESSSAATLAPNTAPAGSYFANCKQAWAAGVAPLLTGQPGYREDMDGDRDGIACETRPSDFSFRCQVFELLTLSRTRRRSSFNAIGASEVVSHTAGDPDSICPRAILFATSTAASSCGGKCGTHRIRYCSLHECGEGGAAAPTARGLKR